MRQRSVWKMLLGIEREVVEDVWVELETIVSVRPKAREKYRRGVCARRCPREDRRQRTGLGLTIRASDIQAEVAPAVAGIAPGREQTLDKLEAELRRR